jgi:hypothetical protein
MPRSKTWKKARETVKDIENVDAAVASNVMYVHAPSMAFLC